jgi:hypothetical protein
VKALAADDLQEARQAAQKADDLLHLIDPDKLNNDKVNGNNGTFC